MKKKEIDIAVGLLFCEPDKMKDLSTPYSHYETSISLIVKKHLEHYLPWEEILLPFSPAVWVCLVIFIFVLLMMSMTLQRIFKPIYPVCTRRVNFFYDSILLLGGSPVPERSFSLGTKIMFITFLLGSLIIRTVYQAKLYDNTRNQISIPPPDTFEDIKRRGYKIMAGPVLKEKLKFDTELFNLVIPIKRCCNHKYGYILHSKEKIVSTFPVDIIEHVRLHEPAFNIFHIMKQRIGKQNVCLHLQRNSILMPSFNVVIGRITDHGFIVKWVREYSSGKKKDLGPVVRALSIFGGLNSLFVTYFLYSLSILVFVIEMLTSRFEYLRKFYCLLNCQIF